MQTDVNCKLEDDETGKKQRVFSLFERDPRYEIQDEK